MGRLKKLMNLHFGENFLQDFHDNNLNDELLQGLLSNSNTHSHLFTRLNIYHHISSFIAHMPHFDIQILAVRRMFVT